jgi:alginate O-acetyltransferase complex protein AlgJ
MNKKKITSFAMVTAFMLLALFPVYGILFPGATAKTDENRGLAPWPPQASLRGMPAAVEAAFNDHFAFRAWMVGANNRLTVMSGATVMSEVAIGKDGWLYYLLDDSREDILRTKHYTPAELAMICDSQQAVKDYLDASGIDYYLVTCPDKYTVYPEFLPALLKGRTGPSCLDEVVAALKANTDVKLIDTRQAVIDAKEQRTVFLKTDTHWNAYGAFAAYTELIGRISQDHPDVRRITESDCSVNVVYKDYRGDLARFIGSSYKPTDQFFEFSVSGSDLVRLDPSYGAWSGDPAYELMSFENPSHPELPTAVVFHDSFFNVMIPLLADSFSKVTFVRSMFVMDEVVKADKPDIVIVDYVERSQGWLLGRVDTFPPRTVD